MFGPLLTMWALYGQPDAIVYADAAKMFNVPVSVMIATKWQETRRSMTNTEVSYAGAEGAMQIMPQVWHWQCGAVWGRRRYERNIYCGALILRVYLERCAENVRCAAFRYVGGYSTYAREVGFHSLMLELKARAPVWPVPTLAEPRGLSPP